MLYDGSDNMITVNASEVQTVSITANGISGNVPGLQPTCVSAIPMIPYDGSSGSIYCVTGADGYIVSPARWAAGGGSITVSRGNGPFEYILTVKASRDPSLSPYTISEGPDFPAFYLACQTDGVVFTTRTFTATTGAQYAFSNDETVLPDPTVVDCPYVNTKDIAWGAMFRMMRKNNSTQYAASGSIAVDTSIAHADGLPPYYQVQGIPVSQLCSARFYAENHYWRPTQLTWQPDNEMVTFNADEFTLFSDIDYAYSGMTFAQYDAAASLPHSDWPHRHSVTWMHARSSTESTSDTARGDHPRTRRTSRSA